MALNKEKILFILHLPPPIHGAAFVGKQISNSNKIKEKFNCTFINLSTSSELSNIGKVSAGKFIVYFKILFKIFKILLFQKVDKVYLAPTVSKGGFYKDYVVYFLVFLFRKKRVNHLHNKGISKREKNGFLNFLYASFFKNAKVILLSQKLYKDVSKFVRTENTFICPNGIKDEMKSFDLKKRVKKNSLNLLFLSNLIESKGVFVLLEACKELLNKNINFICSFVGAEADISKHIFNKKVKELGLKKNVFYLGKKYGDEKKEIFLNTDLFVFPTYYHNETFGMVNLEAMMYGLPIISTDEGGITDIVENNFNGFIIPKKNSKELADRIIDFYNNPKLIEEFGKNGREKFLKEYTYEKFENNLINILSKA